MSDWERRVSTIASSPAGTVLVEWFKERQKAIDKELRSSPIANVQQVQGRALEIDKLIQFFEKYKGS